MEIPYLTPKGTIGQLDFYFHDFLCYSNVQ